LRFIFVYSNLWGKGAGDYPLFERGGSSAHPIMGSVP